MPTGISLERKIEKDIENPKIQDYDIEDEEEEEEDSFEEDDRDSYEED